MDRTPSLPRGAHVLLMAGASTLAILVAPIVTAVSGSLGNFATFLNFLNFLNWIRDGPLSRHHKMHFLQAQRLWPTSRKGNRGGERQGRECDAARTRDWDDPLWTATATATALEERERARASDEREYEVRGKEKRGRRRVGRQGRGELA